MLRATWDDRPVTVTAADQTLTVEVHAWRDAWAMRHELPHHSGLLATTLAQAGLRVLVRKGPFVVELLPRAPWWLRGWARAERRR